MKELSINHKRKANVTVLIPFYNPGAYIKDAIDSVFHQTYQDWKLLLINDTSTDESESLVKPYLSDPRVTVVRNNQNLGQSKTLNVGLALVDTPYVIQLDADDWLSSDALDLLVREGENQPETTAVITGNIKILQENQTGIFVKETIRKGRSFKDKIEFLLANQSIWPRFYRTEALKNVGGWPVNGPFQGRYYEDIRVLLRLIEHYNFYWIDHIMLFHRRHHHNQTNRVKEYAEEIEWTIRDTLKRWGDMYEPVFNFREGGWKFLDKLESKSCHYPYFLTLSGKEKVQLISPFKGVKNSFTIECWVKPKKYISISEEAKYVPLKKQSQSFLIAPKHGESPNQAGIGISIGTNGIVIYEHIKNYSVAALVYETIIQNWVHIAVVWNNAIPALFINGKCVKMGDKRTKKKLLFLSTLIGGYSDDEGFNGEFCHLRIWDHAKNKQQINDHMYQSLYGNENGLCGCWKFNDKLGIL